MKKKNKIVLCLLIVFILMGLSLFKLEDIITKKQRDERITMSFLDVYNPFFVNTNAEISYDNTYHQYTLTKIAEDSKNNVYCILYIPMESIDNNYLLYLNKNTYTDLTTNYGIYNLNGTVRTINKNVTDTILNDNSNADYQIQSAEELNNLFEKNVYLDTVNIQKSNVQVLILIGYILLTISITGIIICFTLLIVNNKQNIKAFIKKHTLSKIIFISSFLPHIIIIAISIISMFTGVQIMTSSTYGFEAFLLSLIIWGGFLFAPLLIVLLIYQIIYIIIHIIKKRKNNS